ncbi:hypothetical protein VCRA2123E76_140085 [Vibrio crassostreae]|nr:hypothetical protein VCRA2123E76_140085 [Vibrio crassostreae]
MSERAELKWGRTELTTGAFGCDHQRLSPALSHSNAIRFPL